MTEYVKRTRISRKAVVSMLLIEMYKVLISCLRPSDAFITLSSLATLKILKTVTFILIEANNFSKRDMNEKITMQKSNLFQFT
jgi:hypothetical protein